MTATVVEGYESLPVARRRLTDAVERLIGEAVEFVNGRRVSAPSLFDRLSAAVFPGGPGRPAAVWLQAAQLVDVISTASLCWSRGSDTPTRLHALTTRNWTVGDCPKISNICDQIEGWVVQIRELLE